MATNTPTPPKAAAPGSPFISTLIGDWYESAFYGDQVPKDLAELLVRFCKKHGMLNGEGMEELIMEAEASDPLWRLFECIFATAAQFTLIRVANGVYDSNAEVLRQIGLRVIDNGDGTVHFDELKENNPALPEGGANNL